MSSQPGAEEDPARPGHRYISPAQLAVTTVVYDAEEAHDHTIIHHPSGPQHTVPAPCPGVDAPASPPAGADSDKDITMPLHRQGLHSSVCGTMLAGWASSSRKQYQVYFHKWITFAKLYNYPLDAPSVPQGLLFLQHLLDGGTKYSGLNTARSMLSTFLVFPGGQTFGKHPHVTRFMRGVSKLCPSVPKYDDTWDPTVVVDLLSSWGKTAHLALHLLTKRTLVLFLLATGQRVQTAHALKRQDIVFNEEVCRVTVSEDVTHSKKYAKKQAFRFRRFNKEEMCLYTHLEQYLRTSRADC